MAHKFSNALIHIIFSTKDRRDLIPKELILTLWKYIAGIGRNHGIPVLAAGGTQNHVHVLVAIPTDVKIARTVQVLKANSSRWIGEHGVAFAWQQGYGAISVSPSHLALVKNYIARQEQHHARRSFEDEPTRRCRAGLSHAAASRLPRIHSQTSRARPRRHLGAQMTLPGKVPMCSPACQSAFIKRRQTIEHHTDDQT